MSADNFSSARLTRIAELERWHFWFAGRRALVDRLRARYAGDDAGLVLDVGCGTGSTLVPLTRRGTPAAGIDLRPEGLRALRRALPVARLAQANATELPLLPRAVGTVTLLDVLEHVDDGAALREAHRVLRPGGWVFVTVPALPVLWSYRDEAAGHRRRYTRKGLQAALAGAGFRVAEVRWYQCVLLPLVALNRFFGRGSRAARDREDAPAPLLNVLFQRINTWEATAGAMIRWPLGSSLAVAARKP
jgi:SAM-dependent methyltransferase